ncbi:MAG: response regulator [Aggregatilineales bacterium]
MSKKFALIIEDNTAIGDIYATTLEMADFTSELVVDGKLALERIDDLTPDLIILDMNLPQVSGHYIYKRIRSDDRLDGTRVIISTANNLVAQMISRDLDKRDRLMMKPVGPRQLLEALETLLD